MSRNNLVEICNNLIRELSIYSDPNMKKVIERLTNYFKRFINDSEYINKVISCNKVNPIKVMFTFNQGEEDLEEQAYNFAIYTLGSFSDRVDIIL